jgi:signal peptidase I
MIDDDPSRGVLTDGPWSAGGPPAAGPTPAKPAKKPGSWRAAREWFVVIAVALGVAFLIRLFLFQPFYIPSGSMLDTLREDDRVLINKLSYKLHDVHRGDVVVFKRPTTSQFDDDINDLIKRVIALPGETIEFRECRVYIDGALLEEPYVDGQCTTPPGSAVDPDGDRKVTIPADHYFVMGDNRNGSSDGRVFGPIPGDLIEGRAFVVMWPPSRWAWL